MGMLHARTLHSLKQTKPISLGKLVPRQKDLNGTATATSIPPHVSHRRGLQGPEALLYMADSQLPAVTAAIEAQQLQLAVQLLGASHPWAAQQYSSDTAQSSTPQQGQHSIDTAVAAAQRSSSTARRDMKSCSAWIGTSHPMFRIHSTQPMGHKLRKYMALPCPCWQPCQLLLLCTCTAHCLIDRPERCVTG
jgi:hypothetical protein